MSYDLDIYKWEKKDYQSNYTFNVSKMFYHSFNVIKDKFKEHIIKEEERLDVDYRIKWEIDNWKSIMQNCNAKVIRIMLYYMIEELKANPTLYKTFNPTNGWGDYEGAINFLESAHNYILENDDEVFVRLCC